MSFVMPNVTLVLCMPLAALAIGCGSTATITRVGAPEIDAKIVGSDEKQLFIETQGLGDTNTIPRNEVTDIDHPGNVAAIIGGVVSAYGVVNIAVGASQCDSQGAAYCTGVFLPAAIGLPIMISGIIRWADSKGAAEAKKGKPTASVSVLPVASLQKNNEFFGANLSVTY